VRIGGPPDPEIRAVEDAGAPRVVTAAASPFMRLAVRAALLTEGLSIAGEVQTAQEAVEASLVARADAVIIDAELDDEIHAIEQIHRELPTAAIIVLSGEDCELDALAAVTAGACGFIPKDTPTDRLGAIVRGALDGEAAIPRKLVRRLLDEVRRHELRRLPPAAALGAELTPREWEVLELIAQGMRDREVSVHLQVSEITVRRHAASAARKLRVEHRAAAIELYRRAVA
jgi:DNA-binding NarL/FixJ family response regulator